MSPTKRPRPVTSAGSSSRGTERPRTRPEGFSVVNALIWAAHRDCFVAPLLAMTTMGCHCERSEAISSTLGSSLLCLAQFGERGAHRGDDALVAGAAAQIGRQQVEQFIVADLGLALQDAGRQHQE